jgi:hypothetical protein
MARFEFESGMILFLFFFTFSSFGGSRLLVSWCAGDRCDMACSDVDRGTSRRPDAEDRVWSHRSGTRVLRCRAVERSGGAVCGLHLTRGDQKREFLG